jgi:hypothetical protein
MKISAFFKALYNSFFSRNFYYLVAQYPLKGSLTFLFLLCAICTLPIHLYYWQKLASIETNQIKEAIINNSNEQINDKTSEAIKNIILQIPIIELHHNKFNIKSDQPVIINNPSTEEALIILNAKGSISSLNQSKARLLITNNKIYLKSFDEKPVEFDINKFFGNSSEKIIIDHIVIINMLSLIQKTLLWTVPLMIFPLTLGLSFVASIFKSLFYSSVAIFLLKIRKLNPDSNNVYKLAIVSSAPSMVIRTFVSLFLLPVIPMQLFGPINFALSVGYFYFALTAIIPSLNIRK